MATPDAVTGRGTATLSLGSTNLSLAYYVVDANHIWLVSSDSLTNTSRVSGQMTRQANAGFIDSSVYSTPTVMSLWGMRFIQGLPTATVALIELSKYASGTVTVQSDVVAEGAYDVYTQSQSQPVTMTSTGRGSLALTIGTSTRNFVIYSDGAGGGFSVQNVSFQWANRGSGELNQLLQWADGGLLLLVFGLHSRQDWAKLRQLTQTSPALRAVQVVQPGQSATALEHVIDTHHHLQTACGASDSSWALLRPDSYLAFKGDGINGHLVSAVSKAWSMA